MKKFNPKYFRIKEWRGDKYVDGVYAESTTNPDFEIEFHAGKTRASFAVECKWRRSFDLGQKPWVEWASERQIQHYKDFSKERNLPVFVVIGIGGQPDNPSELYVIPLFALKYPRATAEYLADFRRKRADTDFFYDNNAQVLK